MQFGPLWPAASHSPFWLSGHSMKPVIKNKEPEPLISHTIQVPSAK